MTESCFNFGDVKEESPTFHGVLTTRIYHRNSLWLRGLFRFLALARKLEHPSQLVLGSTLR